MAKSYLPSVKDREGNIIVGLMGQHDTYGDAHDRKLADGLSFIPHGMTPDPIIEFDKKIGLPNYKASYLGHECAIISGPDFDRLAEEERGNDQCSIKQAG